MSVWGIALSLYHVAADPHAQRVIWDHSLGKSPAPLMINGNDLATQTVQKQHPTLSQMTRVQSCQSIAWHIPSGCKEISCSICCWMPWLTIWVFASESGLSRKSRLWAHWRQFLNRQAVTPIWAPQVLLSATITDLQTLAWDSHVLLPLTPWWYQISNYGAFKSKFETCLVCFQMAIYPYLCDWDIYGFRIGSRPFGSRQYIERWAFHTVIQPANVQSRIPPL